VYHPNRDSNHGRHFGRSLAGAAALSRPLVPLPATPGEVAAALRAARVEGLRDSTSFMNPIVCYLSRNLNIGGKLELRPGVAVLLLLLGGKVHEVPLPLQVLLDGFHRGLHLDLETTK
jgi:hypothetical protein